MHLLDWLVLGGTMTFIIVYGVWKNRQQNTIESYLRGNREAKWLTVALSIMATQASAITFLSAPGQAYTDGMRFVQFYFGLPIAMIVLSVFFVPIYHKLNVYTAYEFLEKRFDLKTRSLAAILFLTQRGLAAGFTIFAPSLVLSSILGWNVTLTNIIIGILVIIYTVIGGTKAVNQTQKLQMGVIFVGMLAAGIMVVQFLPEHVSFGDSLHIAGKMGRLNVVDLEFDPTSKYNIWSGLIGGFFLALSYFGTDQSQVQRYLSGSSIAQSRLGLLFNGMIKIPMQFLILLIGALVYVFFFFNQPPVFFNQVLLNEAREKGFETELQKIENAYTDAHQQKQAAALQLVDALHADNQALIETSTITLQEKAQQTETIRGEAIAVIKQAIPDADTNDTNYIFLSFVKKYLAPGLVGLLIAVILSASMSSTASELNALASTSVIDIYKRMIHSNGSEQHYVRISKLMTIFWGCYAILFSMYANRLGTLIEAVNILGSLVYGVILGVFSVAFFFKKVGSKAVFIAAIIAEACILGLYFFSATPFLWFNVIGCLLVIGISVILQALFKEKSLQ
ncbi:sodium:solute symporter [Algivirga pacifica]|uniref:Sodium:solute symporter n=1 Tax=Algivirga pacifica TaxID=1162670 RepID=A0ABP9D3U8_9BACT